MALSEKLHTFADENTDDGGDLSSEWLYKQYMNTNIKPGDNFYFFCNGGYWNRTKLSGDEYIKGFLYDEYEPYKKRYQEGLNFPMQQRLFNDVCHTTASSREIDEQLIESAVERLEAVQTTNQRLYRNNHQDGWEDITSRFWPEKRD